MANTKGNRTVSASQVNNPVKAAMDKVSMSLYKALYAHVRPLFVKSKNLKSVGEMAPNVAKVPMFVGRAGQGKSSSCQEIVREISEEIGEEVGLLIVNVAALDAETAETVSTLKLAGMGVIQDILCKHMPGVTKEMADSYKKEYRDDLLYGTQTPWISALYTDKPLLVILEEVLNVDYRMAEVIRALISNRCVDGKRIGDRVVFCATSNPPGEGSGAREQCPAFLDRFRCIHVAAVFDEWMDFVFYKNGGIFTPKGQEPSKHVDFFRGFCAFIGPELWESAPSPRTFVAAIDICLRQLEGGEELHISKKTGSGFRKDPNPLIVSLFGHELGEGISGAFWHYLEHGDDLTYRVITVDEWLRSSDEEYAELKKRFETWVDKKMPSFRSASGYDLERAIKSNEDFVNSNIRAGRIVDMLEYLPSDITYNILRNVAKGKSQQLLMAETKKHKKLHDELVKMSREERNAFDNGSL